MLLMNGQPGTSCEGEKPRRPAPRLTKETTRTTTIYYEQRVAKCEDHLDCVEGN